MKKKIVNLTPHNINMRVEDKKVEIPTTGILRLSQKTVRLRDMDTDLGQIPISVTSFGGIDELPPKKDDTIYIVSLLTCQAAPDRDDFYIVNETIRNNEGKIIGARSLSPNPYYTGDKK